MIIEVTFEDEWDEYGNVIDFATYAARLGKKPQCNSLWGESLAPLNECDVINLADRRH